MNCLPRKYTEKHGYIKNYYVLYRLGGENEAAEIFKDLYFSFSFTVESPSALNCKRKVNHIDHAVRIAGIDHVGIGSDREHRAIPDTIEEQRKLEEELANYYPDKSQKIPWPFFISELNHPRRMETIWKGLEKRGYRTGDIEKIMGKNCYRVLKEVHG